MAAAIKGFVTREQWGARRPESVSRNVDPSRGGIAFHHGGEGLPPSSHTGCYERVRDWQAFHMDTRGWVDIAYTVLPCQHGYVFAGRGFGIRTAANGTDDGNDRFLAACWVGGGGATPTRAALDAFEWVTAEVRRLGGGTEVRPHNYFKSTTCPGDALTAHAARLHRTPISTAQEENDGMAEITQERFTELLEGASKALADRIASGGISRAAGLPWNQKYGRTDLSMHAVMGAIHSNVSHIPALQAQIETLAGVVAALSKGEDLDYERMMNDIEERTRRGTAQALIDAGEALRGVEALPSPVVDA